MPPDAAIIAAIRRLQRTDKVIITLAQVEVIRRCPIDGAGDPTVGRCRLRVDIVERHDFIIDGGVDRGRLGVDQPAPLRPGAPLIVVAVAQHVFGAHVDLVIAFETRRQRIAPGGGDSTGRRQGDRQPAAIERCHLVGVEGAAIADHFVQPTGIGGATNGLTQAQDRPGQRGERRHRALRHRHTIDIEPMAAAADNLHRLMPLAVGQRPDGGTDLFAVGLGAEIAAGQVEHPFVGAGRAGGQEGAVAVAALEPERGGDIADGDGGGQVHPVIDAVKAERRAIDPRFASQRTGGIDAGGQRAGCSRAVGKALGADLFVEVEFDQRLINRVKQVRRGKGDLDFGRAGRIVAAVGHLAAQQQGSRDDAAVTQWVHGRLGRGDIDIDVELLGGDITQAVGRLHCDGVVAGRLDQVAAGAIRRAQEIVKGPVVTIEGGRLPAVAVGGHAHLHGAEAAASLSADGRVGGGAGERHLPALIGALAHGHDLVVGNGAADDGRGPIGDDGQGSAAGFAIAYGVDGVAGQGIAPFAAGNRPSIAPGRRTGRGLPTAAVLAHFHGLDVGGGVAGLAAQDDHAAGFGMGDASRPGGGGPVGVDLYAQLLAGGEPLPVRRHVAFSAADHRINTPRDRCATTAGPGIHGQGQGQRVAMPLEERNGLAVRAMGQG